MTPSKYITLEVSEIKRIIIAALNPDDIENNWKWVYLKGPEEARAKKEYLARHASEIKKALIKNAVQKFGDSTNDLFSKNIIGIDVMKNEYNGIPTAK